LHRAKPDLEERGAVRRWTLVVLTVPCAFVLSAARLAMVAQFRRGADDGVCSHRFSLSWHTLTLGRKTRGLWLSCPYAIFSAFRRLGLSVVMLALGLADAIFGFRRATWQRRPPPIPAAERSL